MSEQYEDEEVTRSRVLSNGQVMAFIAGFWLRRRWLLLGSAGLMMVAVVFDILLPSAARALIDKLRADYKAGVIASGDQVVDHLKAQCKGMLAQGRVDLRLAAAPPTVILVTGINGAGKLAPFLQWVYVPAVKDARDEGLEAKNTALGKLMARAVRNRTSFDEQLQTLRAEVTKKYETLLADNRAQLETLSNALSTRLSEWAHPGARLQMDWVSDSGKSIQVHAPVAGIKTGDGAFLGSLARMGHGLQRSYLLALLQELASSGPDQGPTLVLGCEEPELYQHPPQARHLADPADHRAARLPEKPARIKQDRRQAGPARAFGLYPRKGALVPGAV